ncbi:SH3 domain-containing protein [Vacuolonema iberomarrocanum]|uniref:SH3 domain-containing protein n=1 Tax=Vacuolonema iberomarrocanum TaxID=3454632 RepID=UPI003F6DF6CE
MMFQAFGNAFACKRLIRRVTQMAATMALAVSLGVPALAYPARIVGEIPGSQVNVRSAPSVNAPSPSYGLVGDRVEVLNDTRGDDGFTWYYVRFPASGVEGWMRGDFVQSINDPNPPVRWSHTYICGGYSITLEDLGREFAYRSRSNNGNLDLYSDNRENTGYSWIYAFENSNTVYEIEDAWPSAQFPEGFAELRVFENGQPILRRSCRK